jgi:hypothetical protein
MFQLDRGKVKRICPDSPYYIAPIRVRDLLGLSADHYVSIEIYPLLNISLRRYSANEFHVNVHNQWNAPVSNVNVSATYLSDIEVSDLSESDIDSFLDQILEGVHASSLTDSLGSSRLNFTGSAEEGCLIVLAKELTGSSLSTWDLNITDAYQSNSQHVIYSVESSMGSVSGYNTEMVSRNVKIDELDYIVKFTLWSGS